MGAEEHAIHTIKQNRKLRRKKALFGGYFSTPVSNPKDTKYIDYNIDESSFLKRANRKRLISIFIYLSFLGLFSVLLLSYVVGMDFTLKNSIITTTKAHDDNEVSEKRKLSEYNYLTTYASELIGQRKIKGAQRRFSAALDIYPNGKRAVLGMAKCLIISCKTKNEQCTWADEYIQFLKKSNKVSKTELNSILSLR